jgi:acetyl-CoA carboxylase biotin carboxyl carrier protein
MDLTELKKLVQLMLRADLAELELDDTKKGLRVHLKRDTARDTARRAHEASLAGVMQVLPAAQPLAAPAMGGGAPALAAGPAGPPPGTEVFKSPIVGTLYRAASPDSEPFVSAGTRFDEGSVLCIIEAMKVMNEIRAEFAGEIVEVLAENGEPVEFGQPLYLVKKS